MNEAVPTDSRATARSWYALAVLSAISFFAYMDRTALAILMEPIKHDLKLNDTELGLLSGLAFAAFYSTLGLPLARFADRSSRIRLISVCLSLWSVMTAISGFSQNFVQLFLARMGVGVGEAGCVPPAHSLLSDLFPRSRRTLAISIFQMGGAAGTSIGLFLIGMLGQSLGWRAALQLVGVMGVPFALLLFFTVREPPRPFVENGDREPAMAAISALVRRRAFVHLVLGYALGSVSSSGLLQWTPTFLIRSFGLSMATAGAWSGLTSAASTATGLMLGGALATWLVPRDPRWELWIPAIFYAVGTPLYVLMFLSPNFEMAVAFKFVATFMPAVSGGVALAAIQSFAEPHRRATAVSLMLFMSSLLGTGGGPFLIGVLSDWFEPTFGRESLRYALLAGCLIFIWAVIHFLLAARRSIADRVN